MNSSGHNSSKNQGNHKGSKVLQNTNTSSRKGLDANEHSKSKTQSSTTKNKVSLQSKSSQQNLLSSNVWGSGFKSSEVVQESPFFKTGKDCIKSKASTKQRNAILVEDEKETEALNNKLIGKTKYVDKSEKAYNDFLNTKEEFDVLVKEYKGDIDSIFSNRKKLVLHQTQGLI